MRPKLQFLSGPLKGKAVPLTRSVTIGRSGTDIEIDDPRLSQIHAFIQTKDDESWILMDNGSRNGVLIDGKKITKVRLEEDMEFEIGDSLIRVRFREKVKEKPKDSLGRWLHSVSKKIKNSRADMKEINPQVNLRFVEGLQYGTTWELFYGPRVIGSNNLDLSLMEDGLPSNLLVIDVVDASAFLRTKHSHLVRINGEHIDRKTLQHGDTIEIGESKILVEMLSD